MEYPRPTFRIINGTADKTVAIPMTTKDWFELMDLLRVARDASAVFGHYCPRSHAPYFEGRVNTADRLLDSINEGMSS